MAKLPKQWVVNVAYSILGDPFKQWIRNAIEERNKKVAIKKDLNINMDPELAAAYRASTAVSCKYQSHLFVLILKAYFTHLLVFCRDSWHWS